MNFYRALELQNMARKSFHLRASSLLIPASLNFGMVNLIAPILNATMARSHDPAAAIGGYAIAAGIATLIGLPSLRIAQLTLVYSDTPLSLARVKGLVLMLACAAGLLSALAGLTPISQLLVDNLFAAKGKLAAEASTALALLTPLPALLIIRSHLYGLTIRSSNGRAIFYITLAGLATVASITWTMPQLFGSGTTGATISAIAVTTGACIECVLLFIVSVNKPPVFPRPTSATPTYRAMLYFFGPLLVAAFLPTVTIPLVNASVARAANAETNLAALALSRSLFEFLIFPLWGLQPTILSLLGSKESPRKLASYAICIGFLCLAPCLAVAHISQATHLILGNLMGAKGSIYATAIIALKIMVVLPPFLAIEQIYSSALLRLHRSLPFIYINLIRLAVLAFSLYSLSNWTPLSGVVIGALSMTIALLVESITTYGWGKPAQQALQTQVAWPKT